MDLPTKRILSVAIRCTHTGLHAFILALACTHANTHTKHVHIHIHTHPHCTILLPNSANEEEVTDETSRRIPILSTVNPFKCESDARKHILFAGLVQWHFH